MPELRLDLSHDSTATDAAATERLLREFPRVPVRVIADVFAAYRQQTDDIEVATLAARCRIRDACQAA